MARRRQLRDVAERLFNALDIPFFFLEYDSPRAGEFTPLRLVPKPKSVILGLVSTKTPALEDKDALKRRLEDAGRFVDLDRLAVSPQCGFASLDTGNPITPEAQAGKLELVCDLAREIGGILRDFPSVRWLRDNAFKLRRHRCMVAVAVTDGAARVAARHRLSNHPVRVIAASAAGGNPDVMARLLSARLSEIFGNPFVVEDVPGVGGVIAANQTAAAPADGYTLGLNNSGALAINIAINPGEIPLKDFTPIAALARLPTMLVIRPVVPAHTLAEFVALAKTQPGAMSFGSAGIGSIHQLTMMIFAQRPAFTPSRALSRRHRPRQCAVDRRGRRRLVGVQRCLADPYRQAARAVY